MLATVNRSREPQNLPHTHPTHARTVATRPRIRDLTAHHLIPKGVDRAGKRPLPPAAAQRGGSGALSSSCQSGTEQRLPARTYVPGATRRRARWGGVARAQSLARAAAVTVQRTGPGPARVRTKQWWILSGRGRMGNSGHAGGKRRVRSSLATGTAAS
jgi:hypothetical protein